MRKIAVFNRKGGIGKTTISTLIVDALNSSEAQFKVLCIDMDGQSNFSLYMGEELAEGSLDKLYKQQCDIIDTLHVTKNESCAIVHIEDYLGLEKLISTERNPQKVFNRIIKQYEDFTDEAGETYFDIILFDLPPSISMLNLSCLEYADDIIVPVELKEASIKGLIDVVDVLETELEEGAGKIKLVIPNKVEKGLVSYRKNMNLVVDYLAEIELENVLSESIPKRENLSKYTENVIDYIDEEITNIFKRIMNKYVERVL